MLDFQFSNHGSIGLLKPLSPAAHDWVQDNLPAERQEFAGAVVIEPRYADPILEGIILDGLEVN